jgi:predicted DNA-binding transcriptional regulator YafY
MDVPMSLKRRPPTANESNRGALTERLIQILLLLVERPHSQTELARIFRVDNVTIRRNLNELMRYHSITSEKQGREVLYQYLGHATFTPPSLTPGELATLILAQQSIASIGLSSIGSPFGKHSRSLLQKVRASLPAPLQAKLEALSTIFGSAAVPAKDYSRHGPLVDQLTNAALYQQQLSMRYQALHSGQSSERIFEPYAVYFDPDGSTLKVVGFDHRRVMITPFSVDHILSLRETGKTFERPANFSLPKFLADNCFNGFHGMAVRVRLQANGVIARVFSERTFHPSQREIERSFGEDGQLNRLVVELFVAEGRGLERFLLSWMPEIEVLSPLSLRESLAKTLRQALATHTPPS